MDEKKPVIYRLKTDIKPSGHNVKSMFVDEIRALAALPKSMQDELSRPFPKWVADAMLANLDKPFLPALPEIFIPSADDIAAVERMAQSAQSALDDYRRLTEAETILGIDHSRPETILPYNHLPVSYVLQEARQLKSAQEQAAKLTEHGALTLISRILDDLLESAEDEVITQLQQKGALKRLLASQGRGNRPNQGYVTAFERIYVLKTHSQQNAFKAMLIEEKITVLNESDRADRWNAFTQAMKRLKKKFLH